MDEEERRGLSRYFWGQNLDELERVKRSEVIWEVFIFLVSVCAIGWTMGLIIEWTLN